MITIKVKQSQDKVEMELREMEIYMKYKRYMPYLENAGKRGVAALREATPKNTGLTSESWDYEIVADNAGVTIVWSNSNVEKNWFNVALALQYGHGTRNGGFVEGIDYINPALRPLFEEIAKTLWREVNS